MVMPFVLEQVDESPFHVQDSHWQVVVLVLMKGLSLYRIPSLQDSFESRHGLQAMNILLGAQEFTREMFDALLEVLVEG